MSTRAPSPLSRHRDQGAVNESTSRVSSQLASGLEHLLEAAVDGPLQRAFGDIDDKGGRPEHSFSNRAHVHSQQYIRQGARSKSGRVNSPSSRVARKDPQQRLVHIFNTLAAVIELLKV